MEVFSIIIVMVVILVGILIVNKALDSSTAPANEPCKLHKWCTDPSEKLFCLSCGYRPEENQ